MTQASEQVSDTTDEGSSVAATVNPFQRIADLFGILHTVFSDPEVQRTGAMFLDTLESKLTKEVDSGGRGYRSLGR